MTPEQKSKFSKATQNKDVIFYFIPSSDLKQRVILANDPLINSMAEWMKQAIMMCENGKSLLLDSSLIEKYVNGTLDERNVYWLKLGEVRVSGCGNMILNSLNKL